MIPFALGSPYFGPALMLIGIGYMVMVGEPNKGVLRAHWWPYVGWITASALFVAILMSAEAGYLAAKLRLPRNLTTEQSAKITAEIKPIANQFPKPVIVLSLSDSESITYCIEIEKALITGGLFLDLQDNATLMPHQLAGNSPGVFIQVGDVHRPPVLAQKLRQVLGDGGIPAFFVINYTMRPDQFALTTGANADVKLPP